MFAGLEKFTLFSLNCSFLLPSTSVPPASRCIEVSYRRCFAYQLLCIYTRCNYVKCLLFNVYFLFLRSNSCRNKAIFYFINTHNQGRCSISKRITVCRVLPCVSDQEYVGLCSFPLSTVTSNEMFSLECVLGTSKWYQVSSLCCFGFFFVNGW